MDKIFAKFGGRSSQNPAEGETTSLLSDWNNYTQKDVEIASTSETSTLFQNAGTKVIELFRTSYTTVATGVSSATAALPTVENFSIPTAQQLSYFFALQAAGAIFLLLSFFVFLPVLILAPAKFALSFTIGCCCIMMGSFALRGWRAQLSHMFSRERLPFSAAYITTILATLYAALFLKAPLSFILCLVFSGMQVVALLYYMMSYFPGGTQGVKFMLTMCYNAVARCFGGLFK